MAKPKELTQSQQNAIGKHAKELSSLMSNSVYDRKKREVTLTFKDFALTELVKLFMGDKAKSASFSKKLKFQLDDGLSPSDVLMILKMVDKIK